jgi:hypothetical protein
VIPLLLLGGIVLPLLGWLVGVFLLWASPVWSPRDKWLGTLVLPGGLAGAVILPLFPVRTESVSCPPIPAPMPSPAPGDTTGVVVLDAGACASTTSGLPTWVAMALAALALVLPC